MKFKICIKSKSYIISFLPRKATEISLDIPYHPNLSYWMPCEYSTLCTKEYSNLKTWKKRKIINLNKYIKHGNPKFNYKIIFVGKLISIVIIREIIHK